MKIAPDYTQRPKTTSFLSEGIEMEGRLQITGVMRLDGRFEGSLSCDSTLYVGETAQLQGEFVVESLVSSGQIIGQISAADTVRINKPGSVKGDIFTSFIQVDKEVLFDGRCQLRAKEHINHPKFKEPKVPKKPIPHR